MENFSWEQGQLGVFTFVIILVLIGSISSVLRTQSNNNTLKELARSGQPLDPQLMKALSKSGDDGGPAGYFVGGVITLSVAAGMIFFGRRIADIDADPEVAEVFTAIAAFPGFIGVALLLIGVVTAVLSRQKGD